MSQISWHMDAVCVSVVSLAEDHPVEGPVEDHPDPHHVLLALDLEVLDLGHVGRRPHLPRVIGADGLLGWGGRGPGRGTAIEYRS